MSEKANIVFIKRFEIFLDKLLTKEQINFSETDSAKLEYSHFLKNSSVQRKLKQLDIDTHLFESFFLYDDILFQVSKAVDCDQTNSCPLPLTSGRGKSLVH